MFHNLPCYGEGCKSRPAPLFLQILSLAFCGVPALSFRLPPSKHSVFLPKRYLSTYIFLGRRFNKHSEVLPSFRRIRHTLSDIKFSRATSPFRRQLCLSVAGITGLDGLPCIPRCTASRLHHVIEIMGTQYD